MPLSGTSTYDTTAFARHGRVGLALVAIAWTLNWGLDGLRTHLLFFPLWLGYALTVDALVLRLRGTSLYQRSRRGFALLFVLSAPAWWIFEILNWRTQNWIYLGREQFSDLAYFALATLAFSTVIPAVFGTAELVRSFRWVDRLRDGPRLRPTPTVRRVMWAVGFTMLALLLAWPAYFYPFIWGVAFFLVEPTNLMRGRRSVLDYTARGDWRPVVSLTLGGLVCGFFWEFWNVYAYPKWVYDAPGVNFWHVFEMPLLGYIGYMPFALELHALAYALAPEPPELNL